MARSFTFRLAVAFAVAGFAAAALTAGLVNVAFGERFTTYLETRESARVDGLVAALADSYRQRGGWDEHELHQIASVALMDGGSVSMTDARGQRIWRAEAGPSADLHRQMMGTGPLGPPRMVPIAVDGVRVGTATVELPEPGLLPTDVSFRRSVNQVLLLAGVVAGLAAMAAGALIARHTSAPARALTAAASALAGGDRRRRLPTDRSDEFGEMAAAFNRMADAVEREDALRRGFAADVAHELRTPLMILRGEIEAIQDGFVEPRGPALESLREETLRLGRLVDDLQAIAGADAAAFSLDRRTVDLTELAREAAQDAAPLFHAAGVALVLDCPDVVQVEGDPVRLRQVVVNLLSNAAKFTPEGGAAELQVSSAGGMAALRIANEGPGISAEELPHVFDRFYRGARAQAGGSGIGLAVVQQLVLAHGGTVEVASDPDIGTILTVHLPARSAVASPTAR
jgi:two-component system, OmpR family, sensor histidine kinase BaeS